MEFGIVADTVSAEAIKSVRYILSRNWSPEKKREYLSRLFRLTGYDFYEKIFEMNSEVFGSTAIGTEGFSDPDGQIERLSTKLVQNYNLTRPVDVVSGEFYYSVLTDAQQEAYRNAKSLDRHPVITRTAHSGACKWCRAMAGTYVDPGGEVFAHHENCTCSFRVSGYNTRNGTYIGHVPNRYGG